MAYLLDLIFGDPQWKWHPVRLIGRLINRLELKLNINKFNRKFSGVLLVIIVVGLTVFCIWGILKLANFIHPIFYYILCTLFIYFALSIKALAIEANKVKVALMNKNIEVARNNLSLIVGRDTESLDEPEIIRATIETVAESTMDGIVAPIFYCFLGGPILVWVYKVVNTLDSMVGYRSANLKEFGWASATLDGLMNFIPAKITSFLISLSSLCYRKYIFNSIKWGYRYFFKGPEYNSQLTEATMAGVLCVQLGGVNFYKSVPVIKPHIGDDFYSLGIKHIQKSIKISYFCSVSMMLAGISLMVTIGRR